MKCRFTKKHFRKLCAIEFGNTLVILKEAEKLKDERIRTGK